MSRILFVTSLYPPYELGGHEQLCHEVSIGLRARGHDVRVLTSRYGIKSPAEVHDANVIRSLHLMADIHYYKPLDFFLRRPSQEQENLSELKYQINRFKPDVIMFWGMFALSHNLPYWAERWMPGRVTYYIASYWPVDMDIHESYWKMPANRPVTERLKNLLRRMALARLRQGGYPPNLELEHVICCSEYVRRSLIEAGKLSEHAGVVYPGVDPEPFLAQRTNNPPRSQAVKLLYFGRLVRDKGVHTAIEALGLLQESALADKVELTILGSGHPDYEKYLRQIVKEQNVEDCVRFVNKVSREDIPDQIRSFDVFLFTSIWPEPFGRTIIEAMMAGLVVIGADVGGSQEIFERYDRDLLFQPEDAQGLADRISRVVSAPDLRRKRAEIGRELALEQFSISQTVSGIESFLERISARASVRQS